MLAAGLAALGAPALAAAPSGIGGSLAVIMTVCAVRGVGFAVTCVAGYALDRLAHARRSGAARAWPWSAW